MASTHAKDRNATTASPWFCGERLSESAEAIPAGASPGLAPFPGCAASGQWLKRDVRVNLMVPVWLSPGLHFQGVL
jgi:hypothetical protein